MSAKVAPGGSAGVALAAAGSEVSQDSVSTGTNKAKSENYHRINSSGVMKSNVYQFDVSFKVKVRKSLFKSKKGTQDQPKEKVILKEASDSVRSGETLAIMGPSGAGKTSLLKVLTMDAHGGISNGSMTLNGIPINGDRFKRKCAIVPQEDHNWAFLTTKETVNFAADLFLPGTLSKAEKSAAIDALLEKMGLTSCADTLVGNPFMKGLSGGQMRRLSLAVILLKSVDVVFLDEPTSGLDAASAAGIMTFINEITKAEGLIMIFTIHQPSTSIYNAFDRIMLLSDGKMAYCGRRGDVLPYFTSINNPVPEQMNPAEFMLDLVNKDFSDEGKVTQILNAWETSAEGATKHNARIKKAEEDFRMLTGMSKSSISESNVVDPAAPADALSNKSNPGAGLFSQTITMFRRHALLSFRDPVLFTGRMIMFLISTIFFAIIYIDARNRKQNQALQRMWYLIWIVGVPSNMGVIATFAYNWEFHAISREAKNGMVNPIAYLISNTIIQIPLMLVLAVCAISVGGYGMLSFNAGHYLEMMLIYALVFFGFESIAQCLSVSFDNPLLGMLNFMQLWFASFLFCGIFVKIEDIVWPFRIMSYILPLRYGFRSMVYQEYIDSTYNGAELCDPKDDIGCQFHSGEKGNNDGWICDDEDESCWGRDGWQVLDSIGKEFDVASSDNTFFEDVIILLAIAVGFKLVYMVGMVVKSNKISKIEPFPAKQANVGNKSAAAGGAAAGSGAGVINGDSNATVAAAGTAAGGVGIEVFHAEQSLPAGGASGGDATVERAEEGKGGK